MKRRLAKIIKSSDIEGPFNRTNNWRFSVEIKDIGNGCVNKFTADGGICNIYSLMAELRERKTIFYGKGYNSFCLADADTDTDADFCVKLRKGFLLRYKFA